MICAQFKCGTNRIATMKSIRCHTHLYGLEPILTYIQWNWNCLVVSYCDDKTDIHVHALYMYVNQSYKS